MPKTGRPSKLTPERSLKIIDAVRAGNYAEVAARFAGINERTFYKWMEKGEQRPDSPYGHFRQAIKDAEAAAEIHAVVQVRQAMSTNWAAAMTYLERKFPTRWARKDRLELGGKDGGPIDTKTSVTVKYVTVEEPKRPAPAIRVTR